MVQSSFEINGKRIKIPIFTEYKTDYISLDPQQPNSRTYENVIKHIVLFGT